MIRVTRSGGVMGRRSPAMRQKRVKSFPAHRHYRRDGRGGTSSAADEKGFAAVVSRQTDRGR